MGRRERALKQRREWHAKQIAKRMAKRLRSEKQQKRIYGTNRLVPAGSLKKRALKELFGGWVKKYARREKRLFTKRLAQDVCGILRAEFGMGPTPADEWLRLSSCLAQARKRGLQKYKAPQRSMAMLDNCDTLPLTCEAR